MDKQTQREMLSALAKAVGIDTEPNLSGDVVRLGNKVVIPKDASIPEVVEVLKQQHRSENQEIRISGSVPVPPWDGSIALTKAINETLGLVLPVGTPGFFGDSPVEEIEVEVSLGETRKIHWGRLLLPGMGEDAFVQCGVERNTDGLIVFKASISCIRRHEDKAKIIIQRMREIAASESLHKGKAFSLSFVDHEGNRIPIPTPKFFPISTERPIFRKSLEESIERNIFVPLRHTKEMLAMGEPLKRGVLFASPYGHGKTMLASYIATEAVANGWTFMYVKDSMDLPSALQYAQRFQPIVVFVEDVDRVGGTNRTNSVNELLNQLDGIDSKSAQIMTVLTTNHPEDINPAMKRPGRIDLLLSVDAPDAEAVGRMIRHYAHGSLSSKTAIDEACATLDGFAPAFIRETVARARLEALRRTGRADSKITSEDLAQTAREVAHERDTFQSKPKEHSELDATQLSRAFHSAAQALIEPPKKLNGMGQLAIRKAMEGRSN